MGAEGADDYDAVVVHYDNPEVYGVVAALEQQLERPRSVLVVDNSGDLDPERMPPTSFPVDVTGPVGNRGYAAAVNHARERGAASGAASNLLVLTHEVQLDPDCSARLLDVLRQHPEVGSAGPVLRLRSSRDAVFSAGGTLDGAAWPRHLTAVPDAPLERVAWIDGAVMMLRRRALDDVGWLDDGYFLYFEEIDLAARLRVKGWSTVVVAAARAWQEPGGYPPFLAVRNRLLLVRAVPGLLRLPFPLFVLRLVAEIGWVARRRGARSVLPSLGGLVAGLRGERGRPRA